MAQRLGGYGLLLSVYTGQQPAWSETLERFNLSFAEQASIKWIHSGDVFGESVEEEDLEKADRDAVEWPCPLQPHTREYLKQMKTRQAQEKFLAKRAARFARKLTRHTPLEAKQELESRQCDSLVIATRYEPTETLLKMLPYLSASCPFVIYSEFIEPLTECFRELQNKSLAINLRLSDTWTREYQVLPDRTHPNMNMSQSGGFLLTGIKLDPETGINEIDEELLKELRAQIGGRRGKKPKKDVESSSGKRPVDQSSSNGTSKRVRANEG
jgi:tRNA (adenine-N(1)-)-methyltransferase non-catalytic subunit